MAQLLGVVAVNYSTNQMWDWLPTRPGETSGQRKALGRRHVLDLADCGPTQGPGLEAPPRPSPGLPDAPESAPPPQLLDHLVCSSEHARLPRRNCTTFSMFVNRGFATT